MTTDPLKSITITSLPSDGTLKLGGVAVTSGQTIQATDISSGNLTFVPNTNSTASGSFSFKALGGTTSVSAATMSITTSPPGATPLQQLSFAAQNFDTVGGDNSGFCMIPPDSNAAVGLNTVISATNGVLEAFTKTGAALNIFGGSNNESLNRQPTLDDFGKQRRDRVRHDRCDRGREGNHLQPVGPLRRDFGGAERTVHADAGADAAGSRFVRLPHRHLSGLL